MVGGTGCPAKKKVRLKYEKYVVRVYAEMCVANERTVCNWPCAVNKPD